MKGVLSILTVGFFLQLTVSKPVVEPRTVTGSVEGTVILASQQRQIQFGGSRYGRPMQTGNSSDQAPEDSVLVWLVSSSKLETTSPKEPVVLDQKDLKFHPSLLPIRQHGTIRIRNSDPVYHNVFSLSNTRKFDVGRRPRGEYKDVTFDKAGVVDVFCDIHSSMHAVIYVMPPEVLTWTKAKGGESFVLSGLPEGRYELKLYALGYGERSIPVEIKSGETTGVGTITLTS